MRVTETRKEEDAAAPREDEKKATREEKDHAAQREDEKKQADDDWVAEGAL